MNNDALTIVEAVSRSIRAGVDAAWIAWLPREARTPHCLNTYSRVDFADDCLLRWYAQDPKVCKLMVTIEGDHHE